MKNLKIIIVSFLVLGFLGCDKEDAPLNSVYDTVNGQTGISFARSSQSFTVPVDGITQSVGIESTTVSSSARTYNVSVDESTTVSAADYSIGTLTIPAGSFLGTLDVTFNYDNLEDFETNLLVLNLDLPEGVVALNSTTTFSFIREFDLSTFVCNDLKLEIVTDNFGSETEWDITDSNGSVLFSGGPYSDGTAGQAVTASFTLPTGCYTFTIYDSYGDGLFDGNTTGTYNVSCMAVPAVSYASGSGNFGDFESTDFCVN